MALDYNTLQAVINKKYMPTLFDNIFLKYSPTLAWIYQYSRELEGRKLVVPLEYADGGNTQMINPYGSISIVPSEIATAAEYEPKMAVASLVIDEQEIIKSRTPLAIKNIVDLKIKNVEKSFAGSFARALFKMPESDGSMEDPSLFNSLPYLINNHATEAVGRISPTDFAAWKSKVFTDNGGDFTDDFTVAEMTDTTKDTYMKKFFARLLAVAKFRKSSGDVLFVVPQQMWDAYEFILDAQKQGSPLNEDKGVAGFDTLFYRNAKVVAEDAMILEQAENVGEVYCLNSEFLWFAFSPGAKMAQKPFIEAQGTMTSVKKFYSMGNLVTSNRAALCRATGVESLATYVNPGSAKEIAPA